MKSNDVVRCVRGEENAGLKEGGRYQIIFVVRKGSAISGYQPSLSDEDYTAACDLVVVKDVVVGNPPQYPYLWDADRFEVVE